MNAISAFDLHIEEMLYAVRDPSVVQFFILITQFGNVYTVFGLTSVTLIILAYKKRWALAAGLCTSVFGSALIAYILKELVLRPRPGAPLYAYVEPTWALSSFPSLHATLSVAFYVFVLWLAYRTVPVFCGRVAAAAVIALVLAIGFSRLYLGVHYPSDVLAGYVLGGIFAYIGMLVARFSEKRLFSSGQNSSE